MASLLRGVHHAVQSSGAPSAGGLHLGLQDSDICEADALAGLVFDATAPEAPRYLAAAGGQSQRKHSAASRALRLGVVLSRGVAASIPNPVGLFTQEGVVTCFRRLFPGAR